MKFLSWYKNTENKFTINMGLQESQEGPIFAL